MIKFDEEQKRTGIKTLRPNQILNGSKYTTLIPIDENKGVIKKYK